MEKVFVYGFNLGFLFEKLKVPLDSTFKTQYYEGYTKIKKRNFFLKILIVIFSLFGAFRRIKQFKPDFLILIASRPAFITPLVCIFRKKIKIIYFPYDVMCAVYDDYSKNPFFERVAEEICFKSCKGVIHKGPDQDKIIKIQFKINVPFFNIRLISKKSFLKPLKSPNSELHVADVCWSFIHKNSATQYGEVDTIQILINKKIHVHVFTNPIYYKEFEKLHQSKYFHFRGFLKHSELITEINKLDYGIHFDFLEEKEKNSDKYYDTDMPNRLYDYLEAGIPIINENRGNHYKFVMNNKLGFSLTKREFQAITKEELINKRDYFDKEIEETRELLCFENQIPEFLEFMKKVKEVK
jgi:hypothetical protein